eukprot:801337-Prorocentrum_minimum.AAC.3
MANVGSEITARRDIEVTLAETTKRGAGSGERERSTSRSRLGWKATTNSERKQGRASATLQSRSLVAVMPARAEGMVDK